MITRSRSIVLASVVGALAILSGCGKEDAKTKTVLENSAGTWVQACTATTDSTGYIKQDLIVSGDSMSLIQTYASNSDCTTKTMVTNAVYAITLGAAVTEPTGALELNAKTTALRITPHMDAVTNVYNSAQVCTSNGETWATDVERDLTSCAGVGDLAQYTLISLDDTKTPNELWLGDCDQEGKDCSLPEKRPTRNQGTRFVKQ